MYFIILGLFIIFYVLVKMKYINVEKFQDSEIIRRELRADSVNNLASLILVNPDNEGAPSPTDRIFVGEYNESMFPSTVDTLATNNTIFIKNGLKMRDPTNAANEVQLNLDTIKNMKYLPYNFKEKLCLGSSCINKHHIKIIKGRKPFACYIVSAKPRIFFWPWLEVGM